MKRKHSDQFGKTGFSGTCEYLRGARRCKSQQPNGRNNQTMANAFPEQRGIMNGPVKLYKF